MARRGMGRGRTRRVPYDARRALAVDATPERRRGLMHLQRDSSVGERFFESLRLGHGLKTSARAAGVGMGPAYRWLKEAFLAFRDEGLRVAEAQARLGFSSSLMPEWDQARSRP